MVYCEHKNIKKHTIICPDCGRDINEPYDDHYKRISRRYNREEIEEFELHDKDIIVEEDRSNEE